jgi:hypothetical protein
MAFHKYNNIKPVRSYVLSPLEKMIGKITKINDSRITAALTIGGSSSTWRDFHPCGHNASEFIFQHLL